MRLDMHRETGNWPSKQHVVQAWGSYQKKTVGCLLVGMVLLTTGVAANPLLSSQRNDVQIAGNALRSVDTLMRQQEAAERRAQREQAAAERRAQREQAAAERRAQREQAAAERAQRQQAAAERRQAAAERRQQEAERYRQWFNSLSPEQQAAERARQQKEQEIKARLLLGVLNAMGGSGGGSPGPSRSAEDAQHEFNRKMNNIQRDAGTPGARNPYAPQ